MRNVIVRRHRPGRFPAAGALLLGVLTASTGCFGYYATSPEQVEPGEEIRVAIDDDAIRRVSPTALMEGQPKVEGDLVAMTPDSVALSVWIGQAYRGTPFFAAHQTVTVPREQVVAVERRRLSKTRTALAAAGVVAGVVYLISQTDFLADPNPREVDVIPEPPEAPGARFPFDLLGGLRTILARLPSPSASRR